MNSLAKRAAAVPRAAAAYAHASASMSTNAAAPEAATPRRRRAAVDDGTVDLVAPPDPRSNIRPVVYVSSRRRRPSNSPYSAVEFPVTSTPRADELELAYTMHRERVDVTNHRFWATTNADFDAQRAARLAALPPAADPPTAADEAAREAVLAQFYRDWQVGNRDRMDKWVAAWWADIWTDIKLQAKVYVARALRR
ncbi:cytosolic Fe-S cluster assembly factor nbp35 [Vanrija albida]|uniref:Cytosolic Fe-S cluster assembly factor nbp35 n=1 Tax=Vanrija albida TaxID=181172 RepID=A0ABR3PRZ9_9TREE